MIRLIIRQFVTKPLKGCTDEATVRKQYGTKSGGVGIVLNLMLFLGKLIAGLISGSIAHHGGRFEQPVGCRFFHCYAGWLPDGRTQTGY